MDKKKILIVEDDHDLRNTLSESLSGHYEIVQAEDGRQGLAYVLDYKPHLVILDILMPGMSGLQMLEHLRKYPDENVSGTKVIIFSNFASEEYITKAQALKVMDYLVKSNTPTEELIKKLEQALK